MEQNTIDEGKTTAIIAYITVIGTIIAYFMNKDKNNAFAAFHIKQGVKLFIFSIVLNIVLRILISVTGLGILGLAGFLPLVFMVLGAMNASNGKEEPLPVIGTIGG